MRWTESIEVDRPLDDVVRLVADQRELMRWSAWPEATGYRCAVDGDGTSPGSEIVFTDACGVEQGRQRLTMVTRTRVESRLSNRGPFGRTMSPEIDFRLEPVGSGRTRVLLDFRATVPLPAPLRQLAEALVGRRVRRLHARDLEQLKSAAESQPAAP